MTEPSRRLDRLLHAPAGTAVPGVFDPWSARLAAGAGFECLYLSGFAVTATLLGMPDLGLVGGAEMGEVVRRVRRAVPRLPLIVDGDTGFGGVLNIRRTIDDYAAAGADAIQLEDQESPKRCGHMEDKRVVPVEEMVLRLRAARSALDGRPLRIVARTDARATHGLDEALRRAERYLRAGADVLFVEAPRTPEELRAVAERFAGVPLVANMVESGKTPLLTPAELGALGYAIVLFPVTTLFAATGAMVAALRTLRETGRPPGGVDFPEFNRLMDLQSYLDVARELSRPADSDP